MNTRRDEPCYCGSGKRYEACCMSRDAAADLHADPDRERGTPRLHPISGDEHQPKLTREFLEAVIDQVPRHFETLGMTREQMAHAYSAAGRFYEAAPWKLVPQEHEFLATLPSGREWTFRILGHDDEDHRGLGLFSDTDDRYIAIIFDRSLAFPPRRRGRKKFHSAWQVRDRDAYPTVSFMGDVTLDVRQREIVDATLLLDALSRFVEALEPAARSAVARWCTRGVTTSEFHSLDG